MALRFEANSSGLVMRAMPNDQQTVCLLIIDSAGQVSMAVPTFFLLEPSNCCLGFSGGASWSRRDRSRARRSTERITALGCSVAARGRGRLQGIGVRIAAGPDAQLGDRAVERAVTAVDLSSRPLANRARAANPTTLCAGPGAPGKPAENRAPPDAGWRRRCGKTRLALEVAAEVLERFPDACGWSSSRRWSRSASRAGRRRRHRPGSKPAGTDAADVSIEIDLAEQATRLVSHDRGEVKADLSNLTVPKNVVRACTTANSLATIRLRPRINWVATGVATPGRSAPDSGDSPRTGSEHFELAGGRF